MEAGCSCSGGKVVVGKSYCGVEASNDCCGCRVDAANSCWAVVLRILWWQRDSGYTHCWQQIHGGSGTLTGGLIQQSVVSGSAICRRLHEDECSNTKT